MNTSPAQCPTCAEARCHLDTTTRPVILSNDSLDKEFYKKYYDYVRYYYSLSNDKLLYAVTLTLSPREIQHIKRINASPLDFLYNKCLSLKYNGVFIQELTKKNITHLHGIIIADRNIIFHKNRKGYALPDWGASNLFKKLSNAMAIDKWFSYCSKMLITASIVEWLNTPLIACSLCSQGTTGSSAT